MEPFSRGDKFGAWHFASHERRKREKMAVQILHYHFEAAFAVEAGWATTRAISSGIRICDV